MISQDDAATKETLFIDERSGFNIRAFVDFEHKGDIDKLEEAS